MSQRKPRYRVTRKARPTLHDLTPEAALQSAQRDAAMALGYWYWHVPDSRRLSAGLPDTILLGPRQSATPRVIFLENKIEGGTPTAEQAAVLACLARVETPPVSRLVTPATWGDILTLLHNGSDK